MINDNDMLTNSSSEERDSFFGRNSDSETENTNSYVNKSSEFTSEILWESKIKQFKFKKLKKGYMCNFGSNKLYIDDDKFSDGGMVGYIVPVKYTKKDQ